MVPTEREILDRLRRGEITVEEAERLLLSARSSRMLHSGSTTESDRASGTTDATRDLWERLRHVENDASISADTKTNRIIHVTCGVCAAIAIQPIPFADMLILTPIQGVMAYKIAQSRGVEISQDGAVEALKAVIGVVGLGFAGQQIAIALYKIGLPGIGGLMTIPLVYSLTYGIGRAMDRYFSAKATGKTASNDDLVNAFKRGKNEGKARAKEHDSE